MHLHREPGYWHGRLNLGLINLERITLDPAAMSGKPCIRGMRVAQPMTAEVQGARWTDVLIPSAGNLSD